MLVKKTSDGCLGIIEFGGQSLARVFFRLSKFRGRAVAKQIIIAMPAPGYPILGFRGMAATQRKLEQEFFVVWIHGRALPAFSRASVALISSHDGACQRCRKPFILMAPTV